MSNFAIEGLISGFDTTSLIEAMLEVQVKGPVKTYEKRIEKETQKFTAFQSVNAAILSLDIAGQTLGSPTLFKGRKASSSNESIVVASANSSASVGSFNFQVTNLAKTEQISSSIVSIASDPLNLSGQFIVNGKTISVNNDDSLTNISAKINAQNSGVKASVFQVAPNQNKLVLSATSTGSSQIELREVGTSGVLNSLGLIDTANVKYDYTVNATNNGAAGSLFAPGATFGNPGDQFSISDPGGQHTVTVTLAGTGTLTDIANAINTESTTQGANISATVATEGGQERLVISSTTGIPVQFSDPNNLLFSVGVVSGIQSEEFTSPVKTIASQLSLTSGTTGTIELTDGDSSDSISVDVDFTTDSLQTIADKINTAAGLVVGSDISAQVITAGGFSRLEIKSASGNPQFTSDPNNILKTIGVVDNGFKNVDQRGENSQFNFNGVTVNRKTNLINDLVDGVTFALQQESASTVTVNIQEDTENVELAFESYVKAFNDLSSLISELTFFNPQTGEKGALFGDGTLRQLESSLANLISTSVPKLPSTKLSDLNNGEGVSPGKVKITDRAGNALEIDLFGAQTVQDVIDEINTNGTVKVKASVSTSGQSINLVDQSGGFGEFKVEEVGSGTTAQDLGISGQIFSNNFVGSIIFSGGASSVGELGLSLNSEGSLTFDGTQLTQALNDNLEAVKNLVQATNVGFIPKFKNLLKVFTAPNTGALHSSSEAITNKIDGFNKQIKRYENRASVLEQTLRRRFTSLEVTLAQSQQLSDFLAQRLAASG